MSSKSDPVGHRKGMHRSLSMSSLEKNKTQNKTLTRQKTYADLPAHFSKGSLEELRQNLYSKIQEIGRQQNTTEKDFERLEKLVEKIPNDIIAQKDLKQVLKLKKIWLEIQNPLKFKSKEVLEKQIETTEQTLENLGNQIQTQKEKIEKLMQSQKLDISSKKNDILKTRAETENEKQKLERELENTQKQLKKQEIRKKTFETLQEQASQPEIQGQKLSNIERQIKDLKSKIETLKEEVEILLKGKEPSIGLEGLSQKLPPCLVPMKNVLLEQVQQFLSDLEKDGIVSFLKYKDLILESINFYKKETADLIESNKDHLQNPVVQSLTTFINTINSEGIKKLISDFEQKAAELEQAKNDLLKAQMQEQLLEDTPKEKEVKKAEAKVIKFSFAELEKEAAKILKKINDLEKEINDQFFSIKSLDYLNTAIGKLDLPNDCLENINVIKQEVIENRQNEVIKLFKRDAVESIVETLDTSNVLKQELQKYLDLLNGIQEMTDEYSVLKAKQKTTPQDQDKTVILAYEKTKVDEMLKKKSFSQEAGSFLGKIFQYLNQSLKPLYHPKNITAEEISTNLNKIYEDKSTAVIYELDKHIIKVAAESIFKAAVRENSTMTLDGLYRKINQKADDLAENFQNTNRFVIAQELIKSLLSADDEARGGGIKKTFEKERPLTIPLDNFSQGFTALLDNLVDKKEINLKLDNQEITTSKNLIQYLYDKIPEKDKKQISDKPIFLNLIAPRIIVDFSAEIKDQNKEEKEKFLRKIDNNQIDQILPKSAKNQLEVVFQYMANIPE